MDRFLLEADQLGELIEAKSLDLYNRMKGLDISTLGLSEHGDYYFRTSHLSRLFFSIQTSATLLYKAIKETGKKPGDVVVMDYGAGVGTLYLLAGMLGCRRVIYNDHLEEWKNGAKKIADAVSITIDDYIVGDIELTCRQLKEKEIGCDLILSRNVVEHIYSLSSFFSTIYKWQPSAIIFSSTTANFYNPAMHLKHILWHKKWEKQYRSQRLKTITESTLLPNKKDAVKLAKATRGLAGSDLSRAIEEFVSLKKMPEKGRFYTNTCDPDTGVWAENLLSIGSYKKDAEKAGYRLRIEPGFWDTHYTRAYQNMVGNFCNSIIRMGGSAGIIFAPFIYIVAKPEKGLLLPDIRSHDENK